MQWYTFYLGEISQKNKEQSLMKGFNLPKITNEINKDFVKDSNGERIKLTDLLPQHHCPVWGLAPGDSNTPLWKEIKKGDKILFYSHPKYEFVGTVLATIESSNSAEIIWGDKKYSLLIFLEHVEELNIDGEGLNRALGYEGTSFKSIKIKEDKIKRIEESYSSFEALLELLSQKVLDVGVKARARVENEIRDLYNYVGKIDVGNIDYSLALFSDPDNAQDKIVKNKKAQGMKQEAEKLEMPQRIMLGLTGERIINELIKKGDFQNKLDFQLNETIENIEWFNDNNIFKNPQDFKDKSVGHGCDIIVTTNIRKIYVEVKSSLNKANYYTLTGNEFRKMYKESDDKYIIVKVNNLKRVLYGEKIEIKVDCNPKENLMQNINRIKELQLYI